jgi:hypothetical protein
VEVGAGALVGAQSCVLPGARLGEGAVLGPCSVLSGRTPAVPPHSAWAGSPPKPLEQQAQAQALLDEARARGDGGGGCFGSTFGGLGATLVGMLLGCLALTCAGLLSAGMTAKVSLVWSRSWRLESLGSSQSCSASWCRPCAY